MGLGEPDLENGFMQIADDWAVIFYRAPLTELEHRLVWFVIAGTYGHKRRGRLRPIPSARKTMPIPRTHALARELGGNAKWERVRNALSRLVESGVLTRDGDEVGLNKDWHSWKVWDRRSGSAPDPKAFAGDDGPIAPESSEDNSTPIGPESTTEAVAPKPLISPNPPRPKSAPLKFKTVPLASSRSVPGLPTPVDVDVAHDIALADQAALVLAPTRTIAPETPEPKEPAPSRGIDELGIVPPLADVAFSGPYAHLGVAKHDPLPDRAYIWRPDQAGDWWFQPHVPLPDFEVVLQVGAKALEFCRALPDLGGYEMIEWQKANIGDAGDRRMPKRWAVIWSALTDCAGNFATGDRKKLRSEDLLVEFWDLLRRVRVDACVRMRDEDERPATLLRALARLRTLVAMVDSEDSCSTFWRDKVKAMKDLGKQLDSMMKQTAEADWREREDRFLGSWNS